jgi:hypothetical protein
MAIELDADLAQRHGGSLVPLALPGSFTASIEVRKKLAFSKASIFLKKKL